MPSSSAPASRRSEAAEGAAQYVDGGACRFHLAVTHDDDLVCQPRHLGDRMADIDDRYVGFVAQSLEIRQDLGLTRIIEGCERLVHQQQAGRGEKRAADGDALLLAAGKF
ncbi:hypothetical protein ACVIRO_004421 [Rhizobium ruizarguesonis]